MFWGVREMKKAQLMNVNRPQADIDFCYPCVLQTGEHENIVKSVVIKNSKKNPNFHDSVEILDIVRIHYSTDILNCH